MRDSLLIARITISEVLNYKISNSFYCPEFGKKIVNPVVVILKSGESEILMSYEIEKV